MPETFGWTDIEEIAIALQEAHPGRDPLTVRFTELRGLVESLEDFEPEPGQSPNEQILEAIQSAWHEEVQDAGGPAPGDDDDEEGRSYQPNNPFR